MLVVPSESVTLHFFDFIIVVFVHGNIIIGKTYLKYVIKYQSYETRFSEHFCEGKNVHNVQNGGQPEEYFGKQIMTTNKRAFSLFNDTLFELLDY